MTKTRLLLTPALGLLFSATPVAQRRAGEAPRCASQPSAQCVPGVASYFVASYLAEPQYKRNVPPHANTGGAVKGRLIFMARASGEPRPSSWTVTVGGISEHPDEHGNYAVGSLSPGTYKVKAESGDPCYHMASRYSVTIRANRTSTLNIYLRRSC